MMFGQQLGGHENAECVRSQVAVPGVALTELRFLERFGILPGPACKGKPEIATVAFDLKRKAPLAALELEEDQVVKG